MLKEMQERTQHGPTQDSFAPMYIIHSNDERTNIFFTLDMVYSRDRNKFGVQPRRSSVILGCNFRILCAVLLNLRGKSLINIHGMSDNDPINNESPFLMAVFSFCSSDSKHSPVTIWQYVLLHLSTLHIQRETWGGFFKNRYQGPSFLRWKDSK